MNHEPPAHLADKYRVYALFMANDFNVRPTGNMILIHVGRPVSLATLCETYIFQHLELTIEKTGEKIKTNEISGIQKINNDNKPQYELTMDGVLKNI